MLKKMTEKENQFDEFRVEYWREKYLVLSEKVGDFNRKNLSEHDGYFLLASGKAALENVKTFKGGLEPTRRVVLALQKILDERAAAEKIAKKFMKRQNLVKV